MNLYFDFDDTITDSIQNITRIVNRRYGRKVKWTDIEDWDFKDVYPDIPLEDILKIFGEQEFFDTLYPKDGAILGIHKLSKRNNIYIVTKANNENAKQKHEWVKNVLTSMGINVILKTVPLHTSKGVIDMSDGIFVDDNVNFLNETNAKYKIFFNNHKRFDETQEWSGVQVDNWYDLYDIMAEIIGKEKNISNGKI